MTTAVRELVQKFQSLPKPQRDEAAAEILRAAISDSGPITDEELILHGESVFLELEAREAADEGTTTR